VNISEREYKRILAQPGYSSNEPVRSKAPVVWPKSSSKLESKFDQLWALVGGQALQSEHRFSPTRRWRFDRCHVTAKVAIEIQGNGRHQRYTGYRQDREKVNEAQRLGWTVFELTGDQIGWPQLERIRDFINGRLPN